jgi:predicted dehydrogenase
MKKNKTLRLGLIGLGGIGFGEIAIAQEEPLIELVAGADEFPAMRDRALPLLGEGNVFADYRDMIKSVPLDAVFIATPNAFHSPAAIYAMEHGLDVCSEKPMADSLAAAKRTLEASRQTKRLFMVAQNQRFDLQSQWLKGQIEAGLLGEIYTIHARWLRRNALTEGGRWFRQKKLSGGGPLIDLGVHVIDLALYLAGFPTPERVSAQARQNFCDGDVEDWAFGLVRLAGGGILTCEVQEKGFIEKEIIQVELRGLKGGVFIGGPSGTLVFTKQGGVNVDLKPVLGDDWVGARRRELAHFAECSLTGKPTLVPPEQSVHVQAILDGIYRSAKSGKEITLAKV